MSQEKKEEEDSPALKIALIQTIWKLYQKQQRKTNYSDQKKHKLHKDQQNNNNYTISSSKWE